MKKTLITLFAGVSLIIGASTAYAWWAAHAQVNVSRTRIQSVVRNSLDVPIYCRGNVYGETTSGHFLNAWGEGIIYPGRLGYTYVYTDGNNPFVRGWANIRCQTP